MQRGASSWEGGNPDGPAALPPPASHPCLAPCPPQPRAARLLTIRQPNMVVRISQRYSAVPRRHLPFLDVSVTLKKLFPYPLEGILGDTFVTGDHGAKRAATADAAASVTASITSSAA